MNSTVKACVRYNSTYSPFFESNIGAKQGDQSSTLLFLFFVNDILTNINENIDGLFTLENQKLFLLLFADDAVLFAHTPQALSSLLKDLENYCQQWRLSVNTKKTKIMIFENGRHTNYDFVFNNVTLETVTSFKYLGVHLFKNGHWNRTQKHIAKHSQSALHNLFIVFNQLGLSTKEKCNLFDSLVGTKLTYSAEIWGLKESNDIELVHRKFLRKILTVRKSTNSDGLYGELGRYPIIIKQKLKVLKYWIKTINPNNKLLTRNIYHMLKEDADENITYGNKNWAFEIKSLLENIGLAHIWWNQNEVLPNDYDLKIISDRIYDIFKQSWYSNINNSNRLASYSTYKEDFEFETYLNRINVTRFRIALTQFRISAHNLAIEKGRHENIPKENRLCKYCNMKVIESEYHFLLVCPAYTTIRKQYLKPYYCHWPSINKFRSLMSSKSTKVINNLSKYIYYATRSRTLITSNVP